MDKLSVAILGTGNIGSDLLMKTMRSKYLKCSFFVGRSADSKGIERAKKLGVRTSSDSIDAILSDPGCCDLVFDATNAETHANIAPALSRLDKIVVDLTPSKLGFMCIPVLNLAEGLAHKDINLVSCGGQSAVPIAYAIMKAAPETKYIEIASTIASKSAGVGTRINLDEYVINTRSALEKFTGVKKSKVILNLNPAEPPVNMHNTVYAEIENTLDMEKIKKSVSDIIHRMRQFTPGVLIREGPIYENDRVTVINEVIGAGDFLPKYAGNLDVITEAAVAVAEGYAKKTIGNK